MKHAFILALIFLCSCETKDKRQSHSSVDSGRSERIADTSHVAPTLTKNQMIVPGKSIGLISIDETSESVAAKLGPPDVGDAAMGKAMSTWYSKTDTSRSVMRHETDIYFVRIMGPADEASKVKHIRITSPYFTTSDKLGVHSTLAEIKALYPSIKKSATYTSGQNHNIIIYDDIASGIAFEIDENDQCIGITVHETGKKAFDTYIAFFNDIKFFQ